MNHDTYKGAVHFAAGLLAATMGLYNLGEAISTRRKPRHIVNATIYFVAVGWEAYNVHGHWSASDTA